MSFKEKIKKIFSKFTPLYTLLISICVVLILGVVTICQGAEIKNVKRQMQQGYTRSLSELTTYVDNININLAKSVAASDSRELSKLANKIYSSSSGAAAALSSLPVTDVTLSNTSKFLAQVGDYTYNLSLAHIDGGEISDEEYNTLLNLGRYAKSLSESLYGIQDSLFSGEGSGGGDNTVFAGEFEEIEQSFAEYPALIYDGPFSEHIQNASSSILGALSEISPDEAKERALSAVGDERRGDISESGEINGKIPSYVFNITPGNDKNRSISAEVTKNGGMLLWMLDTRIPQETRISVEEAVKKAYDFLSLLKISSMNDTYYEIKDNSVLINFAFGDGGILYYPDLVKVKVALDTGEILGVESHGYIMNHKVRQSGSFKFSDAEVLAAISPKINADSLKRCLIPTDGGGEIYCYEVHGGFDDYEFLIYLNAETLRQENILMLLVNENGTLTI